MTDRYDSLTVLLDREIREDDAEHILNAIRMIKGVAAVEGNVTDQQAWIAKTQARREIEKKLWDALK